MTSSENRAIATCQREGLNYAGPRSARLAAMLHRFTRRWAVRMALGKPLENMRARVKPMALAYLAALETDRTHPA